MESFIFYILKSSICLSLIYVLYMLVLRNTTFLTLKRIYLFVGIFVSLLLPLVSIKKTTIISATGNIQDLTNRANIVPKLQENNINLLLLLICSLFAIGVLIRLGFIIRDIVKIYKLYSLSNVHVEKNKKYCINPTIKSPFSFGNCIFIGDTFFSEVEQEIIIKHELIHIRQLHILDLIAGQIILLLQWFNPLAWLYIKSQKQNLEFITDQTVVQDGVSMAEYQATLLNSLLDHQVFALTQSFNYSNPLKRINMMKRTKTNNLRKLSLILALPLIGGFLWANTSTVYVTEKEPLKGKVVAISVSDTSTTIKKSPLVLVDDVEVKIDDVNPSDIKSISVLRGESATKIYGEKGENGVIIVTKYKDGDDRTPSKLSNAPEFSNISEKLLFIDGVEVKNLDNIDLDNDARSVEIIDRESATKRYGEKGKNGALLVTTKKAVEANK